jgi:hypothetical protein
VIIEAFLIFCPGKFPKVKILVLGFSTAGGFPRIIPIEQVKLQQRILLIKDLTYAKERISIGRGKSNVTLGGKKSIRKKTEIV